MDDKWILVIDREAKTICKTLGTKEEAIIAYIRRWMEQTGGVEEICDALDLELMDFSEEITSI